MFHEKQSLQLCALHTVNNLLQRKAYEKKDFDSICGELSTSFFNPHRSILGLGYYDVNIIMLALVRQGYSSLWFDKRKGIDFLKELDLSDLLGFVVNVKKKSFIPTKHWYAILRASDEKYFNLDSKKASPIELSLDKVMEHISNVLYKKKNASMNQLLLVFPEDKIPPELQHGSPPEPIADDPSSTSSSSSSSSSSAPSSPSGEGASYMTSASRSSPASPSSMPSSTSNLSPPSSPSFSSSSSPSSPSSSSSSLSPAQSPSQASSPIDSSFLS